MVIIYALHNDLLSRLHCRKRLSPFNNNSSRLVWDRVTMWVLGRVFHQCIHAIYEGIRNGVLKVFRLGIDLVQRKAHALYEKEFEQAMTTHEFSRHRETRPGQLNPVVGCVTHITSLSQPFEELGHGGITKLPG